MNHQLPKVHSSLFSLLLSCFWFCFAPSSTSSTWFSSLSLPACLPPSPVPAAAQAITIVETGEKHRANSPGRRQFVRNQKTYGMYTRIHAGLPQPARGNGEQQETRHPPPLHPARKGAAEPASSPRSVTDSLEKATITKPCTNCVLSFFLPPFLCLAALSGVGVGGARLQRQLKHFILASGLGAV